MPTSITSEAILRTAAMFVLMAAAWWLVKRKTGTMRRLGGGGVRVASRTAIGRGSVIAVLEVDGRAFLVGATDRTITLLSELGALESSQVEDDAPAHPPLSRPRMDLVRQIQRMTLRRPNHRRPPRVTRA